MATPTLTGLLKRVAGEFPNRRAVSVSGKLDLTHARLHEIIERAASRLVASGIKPGDVVALTFPNTVEFVIMFLAVIRARATAAPLNAAYTTEEFEFYLSDSESKLLLTQQEGNSSAQAAASKLKIPHATATLRGADSELNLSPSPTESDDPNLISQLSNDPSDMALFLHTSGTTSRPKGVPLTQLNLASSVNNIKSVYKLTESDSTVIVLPLFHVHGLLAGLLSSLAAGAAVALPSAGRFSASTFWKDMDKYNATWYTAVPTIHQIILDRHFSNPESVYPKLRFIRSCSASLAPAILARLEEAFNTPVLEAYAMTEATHLMCSNPLPEDGPHKAGSVGKPVGQEMAILNENGVIQDANVSGEVCLRGPNVTKGYKHNPEANKVAFQFGWFHTGDLGYFDSDGYLHLVGRIKELINRGGEKISPVEVDAVLLSHPDIAQAVAFGVPDDKYGEEICLLCRHRGHSLKRCPKKNDETMDQKLCYNCGETGHSLSQCPQPREDGGTKFANCFICNERGHLSKDCPKNTRGIYPKGGCCKLCGGVTHLARDCPDKGKRGDTAFGRGAIGREVRPTGRVTKFVSGDELDDDFMTENMYSIPKDKSTDSKVIPPDSKDGHVKSKKKQGPKIVNFVG